MYSIFRSIPFLLWLAAAAAAQSTLSYTIDPFAGTARSLGDGGPASSSLLRTPLGVSVDAAGNVYIADSGNARIRKIGVEGVITTIAGGSAGFSGDKGPAAIAQLSFPAKAAVAPNGDIYIADTANGRIRRIGANGIITTVAGTGQAGFNGDSDNATSAQLSSPRDLAVDVSGNVYIADSNNSRVRRLSPGGQITTIAGSGLFGYSGDDNQAARSALAVPRGLAVDRGGNIYIADTLNNRIRKITPDGNISTVAGGNVAGFSGDGGAAVLAQLNAPAAVAADARGNLYIADTGNNRVRRINPQGIISTMAGTSANGFSGDGGAATDAKLNAPQSVAVDASGRVYIADTDNHRIRRIDAQGIITTLAGSDSGAGDGGPALAARLFQPSGVAIDASGNVYIADNLNHRVRRVNPQGIVANVAGNGAAGYTGDNGTATSAQLNNPNGLALDRTGALYIADTGNNVIRRVSGGIISTVAGTGIAGKTGDSGPATDANLYRPSAIAFDRQGNLYIADSGNNRIRIVSGGMIRNFAGDPHGLPGFAGDGGPATAASFDYPISLALDDADNVYISDYFNNRIRRVLAGSSTITTFAGTGVGGETGDGGAATQAQLHLPAGIGFDASRNLYVADLLNNRIRVIAPNGAIRTVAGTGAVGDSGDGGAASAATLASPRDLAVDGQGRIYISDQDNNRVRKLTPSSLSIRTVVNAASLIAGPVAPGEAISIFGPQLGPQVYFDGAPAVVLFASKTQVNVIVPASVAGKTLTQLQVRSDAAGADSFALTVRDAAPALFTIDGSGLGQAAVVNQDGTINSTSNPAPAGTIVSLYGTGNGGLNTTTVRIQGLPAEVLFAGQVSPGLFQVNVRLPADVFPSDRVPVELVVGDFAAQPGTTIAVR
jgi:trimeric autotransporter adhesin